jgi:DNA invertase Pin-like site-specific DNA recombinase
MRLIGYARVSTDEQSTAAQAHELRAAGCTEIHKEHGSGGSRARPVLNQLVERLGPGDVLVVVRLDRLARSLAHLLQILEVLERKGAHFRSLRDPVDTSSPQGKFTLQVIGAAAELERALIRERTFAGLKSAHARGSVSGNPGLRARDPVALRKLEEARDETRFRKLTETAQEWVPEVRRMRPHFSWAEVLRVINARLPADRKPWTQPRLVRAAKRYVREGLLEPHVLERSPRRPPDDRLVTIVAAIKDADPNITLEGIARRLEALHERTPRGARRWSVSSVKMLVDRARSAGLMTTHGDQPTPEIITSRRP